MRLAFGSALLLFFGISSVAEAKGPDLRVTKLSVDKRCRLRFRLAVRGGALDQRSFDAVTVTVDTGFAVKTTGLATIDRKKRLLKNNGFVDHLAPGVVAGRAKVRLGPRPLADANKRNDSASIAAPSRCRNRKPRRAVATSAQQIIARDRRSFRATAFRLIDATAVIPERKVRVVLGIDTDAQGRWFWKAEIENTGNVTLRRGTVRLQAHQEVFYVGRSQPRYRFPSSGFTNRADIAPGASRTETIAFNRCWAAKRMAVDIVDATTGKELSPQRWLRLPSLHPNAISLWIGFDPETKTRTFIVHSHLTKTGIRLKAQCIFRDATSTDQSQWKESACGGRSFLLEPGKKATLVGQVPQYQGPGQRAVIFAKLSTENPAMCGPFSGWREFKSESHVPEIVGWSP